MLNGRNRKKVLAVFMIGCFMLLQFINIGTQVYASEVLSDKQILELKAFSILEGSSDGELDLDKPITRAEYAKCIANILRLDVAMFAANPTHNFIDVKKDDWAYGYIQALAAKGLINGDGDGKFYPESTITGEQALKILVMMLGYKGEAEKLGSYPGGYVTMAANLGIVKGATAALGEPMNRGIAMRFIYNCLDIKPLVSTLSNGQANSEVSDQTVREFLSNNDSIGLMKITGVITANYETYLGDPTSMQKWQVEVDGLLFDKGQTNAQEYLGMKVDMYVQVENGNDKYIIKEIMPNKDNTILKLNLDDINSLTKKKIDYQSAGKSKNLTADIDKNAVFVYNGRIIDNLDKINISEMKDGNIKLISNSSDDTFDVVFINEYESYTVESVKVAENQIVFTDDKFFRGQKSVILDDNDDSITFSLNDASGKAITLSDVKKDDVISIFDSNAKKEDKKDASSLLKIFVCSKTVQGEVVEINSSDRKVTVEDDVYSKEYSYEKDIDVSNLMGDMIRIKLNFEGKIAYLDKNTDSKNYGAIIKVESKGLGKVKVKVAVAGTIQNDVQTIENTSNDASSTTKPQIVAKNKGLDILYLADRIKFDGISMKDKEAISVIQDSMKDNDQTSNNAKYTCVVLPVSYTLNGNGEINKIETLKPYADKGNRSYNAYDKTFGLKASEAFGLAPTTLAICIPYNEQEGQEPSENDYLARSIMNDNQQYNVAPVEFDENTYCPKVVIFNVPMAYNTTGTTTVSSKIGFVTKVSSYLNSANEKTERVVLLTSSGTLTADISSHTVNENVEAGIIKPGDLIHYSLDGVDIIDGYQIVASAKPLPADSLNGADGESEIYIGKIINVKYNIVSNSLNKWATKVTIKGDYLNSKEYYVPKSGMPPIFIYDIVKGTGKLGDSNDFLDNHKRVMMYQSYGKVKAIVIVK